MATYLPVMRVIASYRGLAARGEVDLYTESRQITFDVAAATLVGLEPGAEVACATSSAACTPTGTHSGRAGRDFRERLARVERDLRALLLPLIDSGRHPRRAPPRTCWGCWCSPATVPGRDADQLPGPREHPARRRARRAPRSPPGCSIARSSTVRWRGHAELESLLPPGTERDSRDRRSPEACAGCACCTTP